MAKASANGDGKNKADTIRSILTERPKASVKDVQAAMAEKGVTVSENHVYFIKSKMKDKRQRQRREKATEAGRTSGMPNPALAVTKVKALARELGGMKNLKQLVDVLSE